MKRRELLAAVSASMAGFAGCSGGATVSRKRTTDSSSGPTLTPTPLSEFDCPPHDSYAKPAVCSHTVDIESASVYLLPSETTVDASTGAVELTLYNNSSTELEFNPYQWSIMRKTSSGWEPIEKRLAGDGRLTLSPGKTHSWTFGEVVDSINEKATVDAGTYTAGISVPNPDTSDWIRCITLFRLV